MQVGEAEDDPKNQTDMVQIFAQRNISIVHGVITLVPTSP